MSNLLLQKLRQTGDINEQYDIVMGLLCDSVKVLLVLLNSKNMK
ncbi:MAG: hypothetical protein JETT_2533 [Candidatus Jettenia ecosi]|uniref:Uncharacterized protein n=1 Tax=Candidatus Jettenia ecosi TaxID=2494326 RepID=A0A533Q980_9BACT|nr:MAG: hypothetical protein JETT_2533 [Candidatus Jettenia ecosi]